MDQNLFETEVSVDSLEGDSLTWGVSKALNLNVVVISSEQRIDEFLKSNPESVRDVVESIFRPQIGIVGDDGYVDKSPVLIGGMVYKLDFCNDWNQIGAILHAEEIDFDVNKARSSHCCSRAVMTSKIRGRFGFERVSSFGKNIMESTMRVFVKSHFGEKIKIPNALLETRKPTDAYAPPTLKDRVFLRG